MTGCASRPGLPPGRWVKASRSNMAEQCVEVLFDGERYHLRDTKDRGSGPVFVLDRHLWAALVRVLLTRPAAGACPVVRLDDLRVDRRPDGGLVLRRGVGEPVATLRFTRAEVACFVDGLLNEEFTPLRSA